MKTKQFVSVCLFLMLLVFGSAFFQPENIFAKTTVNINPAERYQTMEGWGTSLCWWGNQIGSWSPENRNELLEKVINPHDGLAYNIFRYNIAGGENPDHNHMRVYADIEGYQPSPGVWNWNADANQRATLNRLIERGEYFDYDIILEAFSNSPPYWMTKSGCASGNTDGSNNLKDDYYDDFAEYLTEVVKHFRDEWGIKFRTLEPLNEPNVNWWTAYGRQEGCSFSVANQRRIIKEVGARLKSKGLADTTVSAPDEYSIDSTLESVRGYDPTTLSYLSQINTHSYHGDQRNQLREFARFHKKRLWQSESGPLNFSGNMMDAVIMLSQRITTDLKEMQASAWIDWQIVDGGNWGSIYVDDENQSFTLTKKFYMHSQYSRFIRPGYTIINADNSRVLAAISPDNKKLVIVATNSSQNNSETFTFDLSKFINVSSNVDVYRTSANQNLAKSSDVSVISKKITDTLPAYSINTYLVTVEEILYGDINEDKKINSIDYTFLKRYILGIINSFPGVYSSQAAELNGDGCINSIDYTLLRRYILKIIDTLPINSPNTPEQFDGNYIIQSKLSKKVIDLSEGSTENGANILQWTYSGRDNQIWELNHISNGYYSIISKASGKALEVYNQSTENSAKITQWDYWGGDNQLWKIKEEQPGYYTISSKLSGKILDVSDGSYEDGANIIQWEYNGGDNQLWKIEKY